MIEPTVAAVRDALAALEDPKARAVNERHGDDHGVNLTKLRGIAKDLKPQQPLARELWATGETAPRLVAVLLSKPKDYSADEYDEMLHDARAPKTIDWLVNYLVKKSPHAEELRGRWLADDDATIRASGWTLTTERVAKKPDGLDLAGMLDEIESDMKQAPSRLQWTMNETLANIGIFHPDLRERAVDIGERLEVLKDYPTPPNCTSPFAPAWIAEIVRRREGS